MAHSDTVSMSFTTLPSLWLAYPKALLARRPMLVPEGRDVPRIEARIDRLAVNAGHLRDYRRVCGFPDDGRLPLTYPHVLAMPLHMAMLTSDAFPVRLLGLVHVRNETRSHRRIAEDDALDVTCTLSGHRETDRGQEFDLETECRGEGRAIWSETSTFLARRRVPRIPDASRAEGKAAAPEASGPVRTTSWHADAGIGRRYAAVSGDINPIHLTDLSAKLFGFDAAIAHGMWSLARTVAELDGERAIDAVWIAVAFKLPIHLPAWVNLQSWETPQGRGFSLKDAQGDKPHMTGSFDRL